MDLHVLEYEQKKAFRDSILKAFRSHFKSQEDEKLDHVSVIRCAKPCRPGSTLRSMTDSDSPKQFSEKAKKKRRRSERNKAKVKMASKATKTDKRIQHLKVPHNVIMKDTDMGQKDRKISAVTGCRLTARLGLFGKGKKSFTVNRIRGPIKVVTPESVRKKAEEDLKNILNDSCADDESQDNQQLWLSKKENTKLVSSVCERAVTDDEGMGGCVVNPGSNPRINTHSILSVSCKSTPCVSIPVAEDFPDSPPLDTIAMNLLSDLKASRWFPGTSYLQELQEDLSKLIKQNCSQNSQHQTPPAGRPFCGIVKSATVKRSLMQSLLSVDHAAGNAAVHKGSHCAVVNMETDDCYHPHISSHCNLQPMLTDTNPITESQGINQCFDAKSLLSHNDSLIASRSHHTTGSERPGQNWDSSAGYGLPPLRVTSDMFNEHNQDMACNSSQPSGYYSHSLHPALLHGTSRPQFASATVSSLGHKAWDNTGPQQAVITKLNEHPEYMPQFHGDYYKDWLDRWPDASHHHHPLQHETMDILEMVDQGQSSSVALKTFPRPGRMTCDSPDSDVSPLYLPPTQILPLKPSLDTPSPPEKLYPRRLY